MFSHTSRITCRMSESGDPKGLPTVPYLSETISLDLLHIGAVIELRIQGDQSCMSTFELQPES